MVDDAQNARPHMVDGWLVETRRALRRQVRVSCFVLYRVHETLMV
jgi:hypothetical protein